VFNEWSANLKTFIFDNFLPATGEQIVPYIDTFLGSISSLTLPGTIMLIVTALLLVIRIEVAFNRIWRVERNRTLVNRVVMYWAALTLGPILIAAAVALSAQKVLGVLGLQEGISPGVHRIGMFLLSWGVIALFFLLVPNRRVQIKHALTGAFLSAILFETAKVVFIAYLSNTNYRVIYGALATIPIFLFWLYIVWNVILFGASLTASLTTYSDYRKYDTDWPTPWEFQLVFRLIGHLWQAQRNGKALSAEELLDLEKQASELQIVRLLSRMEDQEIVHIDEAGNWMLTRDLEELSLGYLYSRGGFYLPLEEIEQLPRKSDWDQAFVASLTYIRKQGQVEWVRSLRSMYLGVEETGALK
jgi:membrane protein